MLTKATMKTEVTIGVAKSSRRVFRIAVWIVAALVFYVLSSGPVWCVVKHTSHPVDTMRTIYYPVILLGDDATDLLERYASWWSPNLH